MRAAYNVCETRGQVFSQSWNKHLSEKSCKDGQREQQGKGVGVLETQANSARGAEIRNCLAAHTMDAEVGECAQ